MSAYCSHIYLSKLETNGKKLDTTNTINELYKTLHSKGIVATRKEFYEDWLNRSECYFRYLKFKNKSPSADALAICSSKLKHYSSLLEQHNYKYLANEFHIYSQRFDELISTNGKLKWLNFVENKSD